MSSGYELCTFKGNLTRDPELRTATKSGDKFMSNAIGVNRKWTDDDGTIHEEKKWINFTLWGTQAENAVKYLVKGQAVLIVGRLESEEDGNPVGYINTETNEYVPQFKMKWIESFIYCEKPGEYSSDDKANSGGSRPARRSTKSGASNTRRPAAKPARSVQRPRPSAAAAEVAADDDDPWNLDDED